MKTLKTLSLVFLIAFALRTTANTQEMRVEPPYWWIGMEHPFVELLVYGEGIARFEATVQHPGVQLLKTRRVENPNYLFLHLHISETCQPGEIELRFVSASENRVLPYRLNDRSKMAAGANGLDASDLIYLIFPDRFANGDLSNDAATGMNDLRVDRDSMFIRHGGDIAGIRQRLDYLDDLGVTALWINPLVENNQPEESYHGYAATDCYRIDPRFGSNDDYRSLIEEAHQRGMQIIADLVYNHWGDRHWIYRDLPDSSWINFWPEYTRTSYRATTLFDPYAHPSEKKRFSEGWFDHHMPDLNQQNPQLANYLIQNSIWMIGHFGIDAFRIDTYAYPDQLFMRNLAKMIRLEFPRFFMFGETWVHGTPTQAWFTERNGTLKPIDSRLQSVTDFQLYYAIQDALNEGFGWTEGSARLYYTLAKDILYRDASRNVTFLDNHDLSRIYSVLGEDTDKLKMAIGFIMTTRGIPSLYYGTEIGLKNFADPDGKVRQDFPGGWPGDPVNKFSAAGRSPEEEAVFSHTRALARYRKSNPELFTGELVHFVPEKGVYVYFRQGGGKTLMCIFNPTGIQTLELGRFRGVLGDVNSGRDILGDFNVDLNDALELPAKTLWLIELN